MLMTNIYRTPLTSFTLKPGTNDMASCNTLTAGKDYYVKFWVAVSGPGTVKISCGDETTFTQDGGRYIGQYYPSANVMKIAMKVVSGSPTVQVTDFTVCEGYASTKQALDSLGISRFNGDTMPLA